MERKNIFLVITLLGLCSVNVYNFFTKRTCKSVEPIAIDKNKPVKMRKFLQNKLWRDNAADRLEKEDGAIIHRIILGDEEYSKQLGLKLMEEAHEVATSKDKEELVGEIGDVLDVLDCIIKLHNCSQDEINAAREQKIKERGGSYYNREFVTVSECLPGSYLEQYLLKQPDKYIEILD